MFSKWRKYSYAAQKQQRSKVFLILVWLAAFFVVLLFLHNFVFEVIDIENETMLPGLKPGDRFIVLSYGFYRLFPSLINREELPLKRGSVVLIDTSLGTTQGFFTRAADSLVRFFTARKLGVLNGENRLYVKRILGLPGDEISLSDYVLKVKPKGESYELTEYEVSGAAYDLMFPDLRWDESLPFSGSMDTLLLGEGDCFALSDDRSGTNDSRTWGPLPLGLISGRLVFRYWPPTRVGPL